MMTSRSKWFDPVKDKLRAYDTQVFDSTSLTISSIESILKPLCAAFAELPRGLEFVEKYLKGTIQQCREIFTIK